MACHVKWLVGSGKLATARFPGFSNTVNKSSLLQKTFTSSHFVHTELRDARLFPFTQTPCILKPNFPYFSLFFSLIHFLERLRLLLPLSRQVPSEARGLRGSQLLPEDDPILHSDKHIQHGD